MVIFVHCVGLLPAWAAPATTTTTLSVTSAGNAVATVTSGIVVTLTATVTVGSNPVTPGQINFCDAAADYCTDIHLLGTAQLTSKGTATLYLRPGIGRHSYRAIFVGTNTDAASSSAASSLTVTGTNPTMTSIASSGAPGDYSLTATVLGNGREPGDDNGNQRETAGNGAGERLLQNADGDFPGRRSLGESRSRQQQQKREGCNDYARRAPATNDIPKGFHFVPR
jgi:Bacterial Ig-like domain (group 3)